MNPSVTELTNEKPPQSANELKRLVLNNISQNVATQRNFENTLDCQNLTIKIPHNSARSSNRKESGIDSSQTLESAINLERTSDRNSPGEMILIKRSEELWLQHMKVI